MSDITAEDIIKNLNLADEYKNWDKFDPYQWSDLLSPKTKILRVFGI